MKKEEIKLLFEKLKKAHDIYVRASNEKQIAIWDALEFVFVKLESMGVARRFSESLLMYGKDFLQAEYPVKPLFSNDPNDSIPAQEKRARPQYAEPGIVLEPPIEPSRPATLEEAEEIFGAKAVDLTDKEKRELALASKHNALVYRPLPATGDHVKIEVLVKSEQGKLPIDKP